MAGSALVAILVGIVALLFVLNGKSGVEPIPPFLGLIGLIVLCGAIATLGRKPGDGRR